MKRFGRSAFVIVLAVFLLSLVACWPFDGGKSTSGSRCQAQYVYDHITDQGQKLVVTDHEQTGNNTGNDVTLTLTAERSKTVTVSADAGIEADLGAIVDGVKVSLHVSVSESVATSISNSPTLKLPDGTTGYGDYGVFVQLASGHLYSSNCGQDYGSHVSAQIPIGAGWCLWVTGQSPTSCESNVPGPTSQNEYTSATSGTPVLDDPLTDNSKGYQWNEGSGYCQFPGNGLHAIRTSGGDINCDATGAGAYSNFTFQVQMAILSGDAGGIDFRSGSGGGYFFTIGQDGSYHIYRAANYSLQSLISGTSGVIHTGAGQTNLITVIAQGATLTFYVNAQRVTAVTDSTYSGGFVGVDAEDITNPTEVVFTDAKVWLR
jgi:hypothetical protein